MGETSKELVTRWSDDFTSKANLLLLAGGKPASPFGDFQGRADFRGLTISTILRSNLSNLDLSSTQFKALGQIGSASVTNCRFDNAVLETNLRKGFQQCSFTRAKLRRAVLGGAFEHCDFAGADLSASLGTEVAFRSCDFSGADLRRALFAYSRWEDCFFDGARFHNGSLHKATFVNGKPALEQLGNTVM